MKKLLAVVLVLAMVLSASAVAFAGSSITPSYDDSPSTPAAGTSTVTNSSGDTVTTTTDGTGSKEVATVTKDGSETVTTTLSTTAANKATDDTPYTTTAVTATEDEAKAPTVKVTVPASASGGDAVVQFAAKNNSNKVALKVKNADGTYSVVKKAAAGEKGPVAVVKGTKEYILVENDKDFTDVPAGWQANAAAFVSSRELMIGETADEFRPNEPIDVATMLTVLGRLDDKVALEDSMGKTWETAGNAWGEKNGYSTTGNMDRTEMAVNFYKYAGSPSVTEADKAVVKGYADAEGLTDAQITAFAWLIKNGIVQGVGNNKLGCKEVAERIQLGAMLERYVDALVK